MIHPEALCLSLDFVPSIVLATQERRLDDDGEADRRCKFVWLRSLWRREALIPAPRLSAEEAGTAARSASCASQVCAIQHRCDTTGLVVNPVVAPISQLFCVTGVSRI